MRLATRGVTGGVRFGRRLSAALPVSSSRSRRSAGSASDGSSLLGEPRVERRRVLRPSRLRDVGMTWPVVVATTGGAARGDPAPRHRRPSVAAHARRRGCRTPTTAPRERRRSPWRRGARPPRSQQVDLAPQVGAAAFCSGGRSCRNTRVSPVRFRHAVCSGNRSTGAGFRGMKLVSTVMLAGVVVRGRPGERFNVTEPVGQHPRQRSRRASAGRLGPAVSGPPPLPDGASHAVDATVPRGPVDAPSRRYAAACPVAAVRLLSSGSRPRSNMAARSRTGVV